MKRTLALVSTAALVLGLVACGGDDDGGDAASGGDFCAAARVADDAGSGVDAALDSGDPDSIRAAFESALADAEEALSLAPDDIRDSVEKVVEGQRRLVELFAADDYDLTKVLANEEFQTLIEDESFTTANDELDAFLTTECGLTDDTTVSTDGGADATVPAGTIDLGNGDPEAALDQFLSLYEIGSGTELTDEQRTCLKDGLRDQLSAEDLSAIASSGNVPDSVTTALGLAFIECDVINP